MGYVMRKVENSENIFEKVEMLTGRCNAGLSILIVIIIESVIGLQIMHESHNSKIYGLIFICLGIMILVLTILFAINYKSIKTYKEILKENIKNSKNQRLFFEGVINSNNSLLLYIDEQCNVLFASKKILKEFATEETCPVGKSVYDIIDYEQFKCFLSEYFKEESSESSEIITFYNKDNQQLCLWVEIQTLYEENMTPYYLISIEDATSTFHAQTLLEASMEVTSNVIVFFDNSGKLVYCSEIAAKIMGYHSRLDVVGMRYYELNKNVARGIAAQIANELKKGNRFHDICSIKVDEHTSKWFNADAVNIMINEDRYGSVVFLYDITEQVEKSQALSETVKLRERLIMTMSHEIRTPMNAIMGSSDLLTLSDHLTGKDRMYVKNIKEASHALINIIDEVTDYTKIEAAEIEIKKEAFYFDEFVKELYCLTNIKAQEKGIRVHIDIDQAIPRMIITDRNRLKQVLRHLLLNAVKFTSQGYVKLKVSRFDRDGRMYLKYVIEDTGKGIECDNKETFFDTNSLMLQEKDKYNLGLGLGLIICRELVTLLGGTLSFDSEKEKGTIFYFELVTETRDDIMLAKKEEMKSDNIFKTKGVKVLVVDDNDVNLLVASSMLKQFDVEVDQVTSGMEAVCRVLNHNYDIIFMDYLMPKMDGLEATKRIRGQRERGKNMVIIALSANVVKDTQRIFEGEWVNDVLSKPLEIRAIAKTLMKWLPKDKIVKTSKESKLEEISYNFKHIFASVDQIDYDLGLSYLGGNVADFVKVLQMSYENIKTKIIHIGSFNYKNDMDKLKFDVHSIRGILLNIGASNLAILSKDIEEAIIADKVDFVVENMEDYIQTIYEFLKQFRQALSDYSNHYAKNDRDEDSYSSLMSEEEYKKAMKKLIYHISRYEYVEINEILAQLIKSSYEERRTNLIQAEQYIKNFKYEEALNIVTENVWK